MSRYWPKASYAEDQPLAHSILNIHVWTRGWTTGAILGAATTSVLQIPKRTRSPNAANFAARLLRSSARGGLIGAPLSILALWGRMRGREEIEWQDRSWRLLVNEGQVEVDDWTVGGVLLGPVIWAAVNGKKGLATAAAAAAGSSSRGYAMGLLGAGSLGGIGGTVGYMIWRYGVNGGKFPGDKAKDQDTVI